MTATIIAFPCAAKRMAIEFACTGANELTRAVDAASCQFAAAAPTGLLPIGYARRCAAFEASVEHLTRTRPDAIEDYVIIDGTDRLISLRAMPALLRSTDHRIN